MHGLGLYFYIARNCKQPKTFYTQIIYYISNLTRIPYKVQQKRGILGGGKVMNTNKIGLLIIVMIAISFFALPGTASLLTLFVLGGFIYPQDKYKIK
jgi:hypothetical protein